MTIDELLKSLPSDQRDIITAAMVQQRTDLQAMFAKTETDLRDIHTELADGKDAQIAKLTTDHAAALQAKDDAFATERATMQADLANAKADLQTAIVANATALSDAQNAADARIAALEAKYNAAAIKWANDPANADQVKAAQVEQIEAKIAQEHAQSDAKIAEEQAQRDAKVAALLAAKEAIQAPAEAALVDAVESVEAKE